jgi:hypothetical protein
LRKNCFLSFWVFLNMMWNLTGSYCSVVGVCVCVCVCVGGWGECHPKISSVASGTFQMKSCSWWDLDAVTWIWTMCHGFRWLSCSGLGRSQIYWLALDFAFLSSLVFSWAKDTWLYSTKASLPQIVHPKSVCSQLFCSGILLWLASPARSFSVLKVRVWVAGREGKWWMCKLAFPSCLAWLVEHRWLVPDCKSSRGLGKDYVDEHSWPAGLETQK